MEGVEEDIRICGLEYARSLQFTDAQYEEALKLVDCPSNSNKLLLALVEVSSREIDSRATLNNNITRSHHEMGKSFSTANQHPKLERGSSLSSGYSSVSSFPLNSSETEKHGLDELTTFTSINLRKIYVDGSNVARTHSKDGSFSWLGIKLCVDWFLRRHHLVKVFVPEDKFWLADRSILEYLNDVLVETPTGCNDDIFVLKAAKHNDGIIVSNDKFRDETAMTDLKSCVHLNRLPYVFVDDLFIPAQDPRGRSGPSLEEFLMHSPVDKSLSSSRKDFNRSPHNLHTKSLDTYKYKTRTHEYNQRNSLDNKQRFDKSSTTYRSSNVQIETTTPQEDVDLMHFDNDQATTTYKPPIEHHRHQIAEIKSSKHYQQKVRRAISLANSHHKDIRPNQTATNVGSGRKSVTCRTISHNI